MRVEHRPSKGHTYLVVVEDVLRAGRWRKSIVASFGRSDDPRATTKLRGFLDALEGGNARHPVSHKRDQSGAGARLPR